MIYVTVKVISVDAHDEKVGVKVGDVIRTVMQFHAGVACYVATLKDGSEHTLLSHQVEMADKTQL